MKEMSQWITDTHNDVKFQFDNETLDSHQWSDIYLMMLRFYPTCPWSQTIHIQGLTDWVFLRPWLPCLVSNGWYIQGHWVVDIRRNNSKTKCPQDAYWWRQKIYKLWWHQDGKYLQVKHKNWNYMIIWNAK